MTLFSRQAVGSRFLRWLRPHAKPILDPPVPQSHGLFGMIHFTPLGASTLQQKKQQRLFRTLFFVVGLVLLALVIPTSPLPHFVGFGAALSPAVTTVAKDVSSYPDTGATPTPPPVSAYPSVPTTPSTAGSSSWIQQALQGVWDSIVHGLASMLQSVLDDATTFGFMFQTPGTLTYAHPVVKNLEQWVVLVADGMLGLFLIIGGYNYMFGMYKSFRELAPRLIVATIAANFSLPILGQFIEICNTLCTGVMGEVLPAGIGNLSLPLGIINWVTAPEYIILVYVLMLIVSVFLILQMLMRLALLNFLLIISPLAWLCFALPQTLPWARAWTQVTVPVIIIQFLQVADLGLGSAFIASFGHASNSPMVLFIGLAVEFSVVKLPDLVMANVNSSRQSQDFGSTVTQTAQKGAEIIELIAA